MDPKPHLKVSLKLFGAPLDGITINFHLVQGYSSGEIFVLLKGIEQTYSMLYTRVNLVDLVQRKDKIVITIIFKLDLGSTRDKARVTGQECQPELAQFFFKKSK
jgi:hypothetical protein